MIQSPWELMSAGVVKPVAAGAVASKKQMNDVVANFESLLVRECLRQVRSSSLSGEGSSTSEGYLQMVDDQLAHLISRQGGMGLSGQLANQLLQQVRQASLIGQGDIAVTNSMREGSD